MTTTKKRRREPAVRRFLPVLPPIDLDLSSRIDLRGATKAVELRNAPTGLEIELSMARASVLTLTVEDPDYRLLRDNTLLSVIDLDLAPAGDSPAERQERIDMRYVRRWRMDRRRAVGGIATSGTSTQIRFWHLADAALKSRSSSMRKPASRLDLGGFVALLAREVRDDITLVPVVPKPGAAPPAEATSGSSSSSSSGGSSSSGFSETAAKKITVKGQRADREQLRNMDTVLNVAVKLKAPPRAVLAMVVANIGEANYRTKARNPKSGAYGLFQLLPSIARSFGLDPLNIEACAEQFLTHGYTKGKRGDNGAIPMSKRNPNMTAGTIAALVEGSRTGGGFYDRHDSEARRIIEAWSGKPLAQWRAVTGAGSGGGREERPSEWRRGTAKEPESSWTALGRYAEQLGRRRFTSANRLVVARDQDLILAQPHMSVPLTDAMFVERPQIDQDDGAKVTSVDFQVLAEAWSAPPGAVVDLTDAGPADGAWLVETIRARAGDPLVDVSLTQPQTQRPASAGSSSSRSSSSRGGNAAVAWAAKQVGTRETGTNTGPKIDQWSRAFGHRAIPWCGAFVGFAMKQAGVSVPNWIVSTGAIHQNARSRRAPFGRGLTTPGQAKPGDLALIGPPGPRGHVGLVQRVDQSRKVVHTIDGNYSNRVATVSRAFSQVHSIVRVTYP